MMSKMQTLRKLSKILLQIKTCLTDTFFFVGKSIMSKNQKLKVINKNEAALPTDSASATVAPPCKTPSG